MYPQNESNFNKMYELKLIKTITSLYNSVSQNTETHTFTHNQIKILEERLKTLREQMPTECRQTNDIGTDTILEENFDHPNDGKLYSLRSWLEHYLKIDYLTAYSLANEHCTYIRDNYMSKYNKNPIKACKEWIYNNDEKVKEVVVNSFSRLEFLDVIKPYFDSHYTAEAAT